MSVQNKLFFNGSIAYTLYGFCQLWCYCLLQCLKQVCVAEVVVLLLSHRASRVKRLFLKHLLVYCQLSSRQNIVRDHPRVTYLQAAISAFCAQEISGICPL